MNDSLSKEQFELFLNAVQCPESVNRSFAFDVFSLAYQGIVELAQKDTLGKIGGVNLYALINYCIGEIIYTIAEIKPTEINEFYNNPTSLQTIASIAADKYLSLTCYNMNEKKSTNQYLPSISSLNLYLNFMINVLNSFKINESGKTLLNDILIKSISISRSITNLLTDGYETEAFGVWRTLHECECTLIILDKYPETIPLYLKHMDYGIAYEQGLEKEDRSDTEEMFNNIKEQMRAHDLKSKDIKKFIEYGWLYKIKEFSKNPDFKLNFRDGLEAIAGLKEYSKTYMESSEIVHSTPMLIYSNKTYYYFITLLSTYEAFFRIEKIFYNFFKKNTAVETFEQYRAFRNGYYSQMVHIHQRETSEFIAWQKATIIKRQDSKNAQ